MKQAISYPNHRYLVLGLAVGLVLTNLLLIRQNLALRSALRPTHRQTLPVGSSLRSISGFDIDGRALHLEFADTGKSKLLFYMSTTCPYTDVQFSYWCRVIQAADAQAFDFVGLVADVEAVDVIEGYLRSRPCTVPQVLRIDPEVVQRLRLSLTPSTMMVAGDGRIRRVWNGLWRREEFQEALVIVSHPR